MAETPQGHWQKTILDSLLQDALLGGKDAEPYQKPSTWWYNPTNSASLRLSSFAWNVVRSQSSLIFKRFVLEKELLPKTFVQLERHFTAPYYIQNHKTIHLLGETEIVMLSLHGNNLQQYLDNHST